MRPRLLDLFCGAGGAAMGYHRAGFDVVGVDIAPQPNYPFEFHQYDALQWLEEIVGGRDVWTYAAIHASPPCQAYSSLRSLYRHLEHPDLIGPTRELLERTGLPWVIENVPGAPTRHLIVLCGSMFGLGITNRQLRRHRNFETSFPIMSPPCHHEGGTIGVYGGGPHSRPGRSYQGTIAEKREAMGIDWMSSSEINQAIPPVYTEFIGAALLEHLKATVAA